MVLDAKDWGMDKTKIWFEGICRYGLSMNEQAWDLVIVPLFDEINQMQGQLKRSESKLNYMLAEKDEEIRRLKKQLEQSHKMTKLMASQPKDMKLEHIKLPEGVSGVKVIKLESGVKDFEGILNNLSPYPQKWKTIGDGPMGKGDDDYE